MRPFLNSEIFDAIWLVEHADGWLVLTHRRQGWIFADRTAAYEEALKLATETGLPFCEQMP